jgi:hypothetical protein
MANSRQPWSDTIASVGREISDLLAERCSFPIESTAPVPRQVCERHPAGPSLKPENEMLNVLAARLGDHANDCMARRDVALDLRLAAIACWRLAFVRFRLAEIAEAAVENPNWDTASIARDIRHDLDTAEEGDSCSPPLSACAPRRSSRPASPAVSR